MQFGLCLVHFKTGRRFFFSDLALFEVHCVQFLPNGTNVFKSGPPAKTTICTVSRGRLRRRNQTKRSSKLLLLACQFSRGNRDKKQFASTIRAYCRNDIKAVAAAAIRSYVFFSLAPISIKTKCREVSEIFLPFFDSKKWPNFRNPEFGRISGKINLQRNPK